MTHDKTYSVERVEMFFPPLTGFDEKEIEKAKALLEEYEEAQEEQQKNIIVKCRSFVAYPRIKGCGQFSKISECDWIDYIKDRNEAYNDAWDITDQVFICPKCNAQNRVYETPELKELIKYFKSHKQIEDR